MAKKSRAREDRGRDTEFAVAEYYCERGWPAAHVGSRSAAGKDIKAMPWLAPEVKARKDFHPVEFIKQARYNAADNEMPYVIFRPNGIGRNNQDDFLVVRRMADDTPLLQAKYLMPQFIDDGFGNGEFACSPVCDMAVVRPGKFQCSCEEAA